jgi:hypothetical protein
VNRTRLRKWVLHLWLRPGYRYDVKGIENTAIIRCGAKMPVMVNIPFRDGALLMAALSELP